MCVLPLPCVVMFVLGFVVFIGVLIAGVVFCVCCLVLFAAVAVVVVA